MVAKSFLLIYVAAIGSL